MMRIGQGYDVHAFGGDKPLILGGVTLPDHQGLLAHSDGDVVLHAVCDALLGAVGLGDIGRHFPDTEAKWKDANSRDLVRHCMTLVRAQGYLVGNLDCTVMAQAPKMAPYIPAMVETLCADLQVDASQVNVKATTTEKLGFVGREEGIAVTAVVLLVHK